MKRADFRTGTEIQDTIYSDFHIDMLSHPEKKDLLVQTNENAIRSSIKALIMTDKGERLFQPQIGSNIQKLLFEPIGNIATAQLKTYITETITNYEPRAVLRGVAVEPNHTRQSYTVTISFSVINSDRVITVPITLERVR